MTKITVTNGKSVTPGFDLFERDLWKIVSDSYIPFGRYTEVREKTASGGEMVIQGTFYKHHDDDEGDRHTGTLDTLFIQDEDGRVLAKVDDISMGINAFMEMIVARGFFQSETSVRKISDVFFDDANAVRLSNKDDTTDVRSVSGRSDLKIMALGGDDRITGDKSGNRLDGGSGDDRIDGKDGADWLAGGEGKDKLVGGSGTDVLDGGAQKDILWGGAAADTFVFGKGDGKGNVVKDFENGRDLIEIGKGARDFEDLRIANDEDGVRIKFADVSLILEDTARSDLSEADFLF
jgi:serralysin